MFFGIFCFLGVGFRVFWLPFLGFFYGSCKGSFLGSFKGSSLRVPESLDVFL